MACTTLACSWCDVQVSTNCPQEIHYHLELFPTFTNQNIAISNISSVGQTSLILSSADIQLNEHYEVIMRIEGAPTFLHRLNLSMHVLRVTVITLCNAVKTSPNYSVVNH